MNSDNSGEEGFDIRTVDLRNLLAPLLRERLTLREGASFGDYRLIRRLGTGGFGEVWEAENAKSQRRLALKVLTQVRPSSPDLVERFKREGRLAASLNHPRCVFVFGAEEIEGYPAITMELMRGGTLQDRLGRGPMPSKEAVDVILDIIEGLKASNKAGILHRDIKPSNCFLDENGKGKIGDFGISKSLETPSDLTLTGAFVGTPSYASPEQVRGREVGLQSDIYSVGATLYALLTGMAPFLGANAGEVLARIGTEMPASFSKYSVRVPRELERVVMRAMSKDKQKRFQTYTELQAALLPFSSTRPEPGNVAKRFVAYQIDRLLIRSVLLLPTLYVFLPERFHEGFLYPIAWNLVWRTPWPLMSVPVFLYFALMEKRWGRTPGKAALGLRVTTRDGFPPGWRHVLIRSAVLVGISVLSGVLTRISVPSDTVDPSPSLLAYAQIASLIQLGLSSLPLVTMRSRNGYAGVHELCSDTRVLAVPAREAIIVPTTPYEDPPALESVQRYGPYRTLKTLWKTPDETLLLASDELLDRKVWIHEQPTTTALPISGLLEVRSGRLHWLNGAREAAVSWDAYNVPEGIDFCGWIGKNGPLKWEEIRLILLAMSKELAIVLQRGESSPRFSVQHIWIDSAGNARLMNFPSKNVAGDNFAPSEWEPFIYEITSLGLRGDSEPSDNPVRILPKNPLPEHAQRLVDRISGEGQRLTSPTELIAALSKMERQPAQLSWGRRMAPLLVNTFPAIMGAGVVSILLLAASLLQPSSTRPSSLWADLFTVTFYQSEIRSLEQETVLRDLARASVYASELHQTDGLGVEDGERRRQAILKILAYAFRVAPSQGALGATAVRVLEPNLRQILKSASDQFPQATAEEAWQARRTLQVFQDALTRQEGLMKVLAYTHKSLRSRAGSGSVFLAGLPADLRQTMLSAAQQFPQVTTEEAAKARQIVGVISPTLTENQTKALFLVLAVAFGVGGLVGSAILGSGPLFRIFGITLITRERRRAKELRWLGRCCVAWSPLFLMPLMIPWSWIALAYLAALVFSAVYAIASPDRGIPDIVAGTYLVPR